MNPFVPSEPLESAAQDDVSESGPRARLTRGEGELSIYVSQERNLHIQKLKSTSPGKISHQVMISSARSLVLRSVTREQRVMQLNFIFRGAHSRTTVGPVFARDVNIGYELLHNMMALADEKWY